MASTINAQNTSSGVAITPDSSGILQLQTAGTTALTVDASQNVGIGTSSPNYKLEALSASNTYIGSTTTNAVASSGFIVNSSGGSGAVRSIPAVLAS